MRSGATLLGFGLLLGCEDPLKPAERIDGPRVLAARVSTAEGDASLVPGQAGEADVLLAGPAGPLAARLAYRLCPAAESQRGVPYCVAEAIAVGVTDSVAGPLTFNVPPALAEGLRLVLVGAACVDGEPELADAPLAWRCTSGSEPLGFTFDAFTLASVPQPNPDLAALRVSVAQTSIEPSAATAAPACSAGTTRVAVGETHLLELELGEAVREPQETLQLSHFSTRGDFQRHFSFVSPEEKPRVSLTWRAPSELGPVKQYLVVRDGRGGVGWATWNLCVR